MQKILFAVAVISILTLAACNSDTTLGTSQAPTTPPHIGLISGSREVRCGQEATIVIKGVPGTEYQTKVVYNGRNYSTAQWLEYKTMGDDGIMSWSWLISNSAVPGPAKVTVTGSDGLGIIWNLAIIQ